jgi:hypothetical protein
MNWLRFPKSPRWLKTPPTACLTGTNDCAGDSRPVRLLRPYRRTNPLWGANARSRSPQAAPPFA